MERYEKQVKALKHEALTMAWHMRGGLTYAEVMSIGDQERTIISDIVKDHIEATKKSGIPFF